MNGGTQIPRWVRPAVYRLRWVALAAIVASVFFIDVFRIYWLFPLFAVAALVVVLSIEIERR